VISHVQARAPEHSSARDHCAAREHAAARARFTAHEVHPLGPNNRAVRDSAPHPTVGAALRVTTCKSEPVGGLGGAALAPPKL
jgi:hypothetical protein